jgi:hypothetical protein
MMTGFYPYRGITPQGGAYYRMPAQALAQPTPLATNEALPYWVARDMGLPILPPPHVLAPTFMNMSWVPQATRPTYVPYPYPVPNIIMPPPPPSPAAAPMPKYSEAPPVSSEPAPKTAPKTPEVIPLNQISAALESTSSVQQKEGLAGLQKLLSGNPDFKNPKSGGIPEAMLLKALKTSDEILLGDFLGSLSSDLETATPRIRRALRSIQSNANFMGPTRQLASQVAQGRPAPSLLKPGQFTANAPIKQAGLPALASLERQPSVSEVLD